MTAQITSLLQPTRAQVRVATAAVEWYIQRYYGTPADPGVPSMFCDPAQVGPFALDAAAFAEGDAPTLFRLLIATTMFQRRQDQQILRILRGMGQADAAELTDARRLRLMADECPCPHLKTLTVLQDECDLDKDEQTRQGICGRCPEVPCHLKRHTVLLKRYGHFGKVPTSAALMLREAGVADLPALRASILQSERTRIGRAIALEAALARSWRISQKIASMFLSTVANPDLPPRSAPWSAGIDWTYFVVIDSNVDLFLAAVGYRGSSSYDARRAFVRALAHEVDLRDYDRRLHSYNPRLVQQALYLFMSVANRRANERDCMHLGPNACKRCPRALAANCSVRS